MEHYVSKFKNQKVNFYDTVPYITTNQILEILGLYCFAFSAFIIEKTFTQSNFLPSKTEIVSMYFPTKI